jgi:MoaA/NifB/PqqE/SkfB family radical SAM enzyme
MKTLTVKKEKRNMPLNQDTLSRVADVKQFSSEKILKHLDKVSAWIGGGNPSPVTVEIDMTNICNHKCPECVVSYYQRKDNSSLSKEFAASIVDQLSEAGARGLIFTGGGDPLCNPHTPDIALRAKEKGLDVGFITNGQLLNEEASGKILESCVWVRVSLDAATPEVFLRTHGSNEHSFRKVVENIGRLTDMKRRLNSRCTIGVGYLTSAETKGDLDKAAVLCKNLGVDYIQFRPMQIHHGGDFKYNWEDVMDEIQQCMKHNEMNFNVLYSKHKYDMMKRSDYGRNYGKCYGHQFATVVSATGKMYLCCHLRGYEKYCIGDLNKNTFEEIWNSEERIKAYENINFRDCIPLCRCNTFNQVLWNITRPKEHVSFL